MRHRPVCVKCECELRPETNGFGVIDMFQPKTPEPIPYKIWDADKFKCPKCDIEIVVGFGDGPIAHHFESNRMQQLIEGYEAGEGLVKNYEYRKEENNG